jgi:WD40 repeat protein
MLSIIGQLGNVDDQAVGATSHALLKELQREQTPATRLSYLLRDRLSLPTSSPTLTKVQKIPPLEYDLYQLRVLRLEQSRQAVYIPPMAKPSLRAKDDDLFALMEKIQEFLASERQVMLVLGDSGAGKSTFNHHLEHYLWTDYNPGNPIPLFINLPAIAQPDQDMIAKQLNSHSFSDDQIMEIKQHRKLILICDGYDESQQLVNLHRTNSLNQPGQWNTKMIISCRTQFLGPDYHSRFVPQGDGDHYNRGAPHLFQEAVIAPFSKAQIENYVEQYVPLEPRTWSTADYMDRLTTIPNLLDLVRNPFLLSLALEALPGVTEGKQDLSVIKITRVQLYDTFVNHWLDVNKRRLERNNALSMDDRDMLNQLVNAGFTSLGLDYSTRLARAIFDRQNGNPVIKYVHFSDKNTWRAEFFGPQPDVRLLRESSPLTRTGNHFRFVHRSMLEYFLSRAIYSPINTTDDDDLQAIDEFVTSPSLSSAASLLDADGPLFRMNLLSEPSIIQFLCDRVMSNPDFEQQLRAVIDLSKVNVSAATAAANAITILVRADVDFNGADLQGVKISGANLSEGQFDSAQFQGADLRGVNLSRSWLRQADMSNAQLEGVQFGEFPYLETDGSVKCCSYSPDGSMLAVGLDDDGLDVYNTATWTIILRIRETGYVLCVAFSPDSQKIAIGGSDNMVRLHGCSSGEDVLVMEGHTALINSVAFSPCGMLLASAGNDRSVRLWNSETGECHFVLKGHTGGIESVKFSSDGRQLVSGSWDGTIRFWDPKTGEPGLVLEYLLGDCNCIGYSHDGRWVVSGNDKGVLQLWDEVSGTLGPALGGHTSSVKGVAFSLDDQWIASSSNDTTVKLWDPSTGVCVSTLTGHGRYVNDVAFSPDGLQLASGGNDGRVRLWDISSISRGVELQRHHVDDDNKAICSSKDLFIFSTRNRNVRKWDPVSGKPGPFVFTFPEGTGIGTMAVSPDGNQIAMSTTSGLVQLWNRRTCTVGSVLKGHNGFVIDILYSPCGRWLLSRDWNDDVLLWDLHGMKQESHVRAEVEEQGFSKARHAFFSPSGRRIAILYRDNFVRIFDLPSRNLVKSRGMERERPWQLAYSPNSQQLAIGCRDGSIYLWTVDQSGDEEFSAKLSGHQDTIYSIAYSPCGQWIASGGEDKTVRLWHRQPEEPESWSCVATVHGFFGSVRQIDWSPVIPMEFVTHCEDGSARIWRVSNDGGKVVVGMRWGSNLRMLYAEGLVLKDATCLIPTHQNLLVQRGALGVSVAHEGDESTP